MFRCVGVGRRGRLGDSSRMRCRNGSSKCRRGRSRAAGSPGKTAGEECSAVVNA